MGKGSRSDTYTVLGKRFLVPEEGVALASGAAQSGRSEAPLPRPSLFTSQSFVFCLHNTNKQTNKQTNKFISLSEKIAFIYQPSLIYAQCTHRCPY